MVKSEAAELRRLAARAGRPGFPIRVSDISVQVWSRILTSLMSDAGAVGRSGPTTGISLKREQGSLKGVDDAFVELRRIAHGPAEQPLAVRAAQQFADWLDDRSFETSRPGTVPVVVEAMPVVVVEGTLRHLLWRSRGDLVLAFERSDGAGGWLPVGTTARRLPRMAALSGFAGEYVAMVARQVCWPSALTSTPPLGNELA